MKKRNTCGSCFLIISCTKTKFPSDFDIFSLSILIYPLCIQYRANAFPVTLQFEQFHFHDAGMLNPDLQHEYQSSPLDIS